MPKWTTVGGIVWGSVQGLSDRLSAAITLINVPRGCVLALALFLFANRSPGLCLDLVLMQMTKRNT